MRRAGFSWSRDHHSLQLVGNCPRMVVRLDAVALSAHLVSRGLSLILWVEMEAGPRPDVCVQWLFGLTHVLISPFFTEPRSCVPTWACVLWVASLSGLPA